MLAAQRIWVSRGSFAAGRGPRRGGGRANLRFPASRTAEGSFTPRRQGKKRSKIWARDPFFMPDLAKTLFSGNV